MLILQILSLKLHHFQSNAINIFTGNSFVVHPCRAACLIDDTGKDGRVALVHNYELRTANISTVYNYQRQ